MHENATINQWISSENIDRTSITVKKQEQKIDLTNKFRIEVSV
jgi:hypothetical protein